MINPFVYKTSKHSVQEPILRSLYKDSTESFRQVLMPEDVITPKTPPKILVVDDDPTFGRIIGRAAQFKGAVAKGIDRVEQLQQLDSFNFDVVIMDYDMGDLTGFDLTRLIERKVREEIPVILVSQMNRSDSSKWPSSIREFLHKGLGPYTILDAAFEAHEIKCLYKRIQDQRSLETSGRRQTKSKN